MRPRGIGTFSQSGTVTGTDSSSITLDAVITGGTGIFLGDTGKSTVTGISTQTSPTTASFTGSYITEITTAPEPSSMALLFAGMGFLLVMRKRTAPGLRI
jgi:hypothetical protein